MTGTGSTAFFDVGTTLPASEVAQPKHRTSCGKLGRDADQPHSAIEARLLLQKMGTASPYKQSSSSSVGKKRVLFRNLGGVAFMCAISAFAMISG